MKKKFIVFLAVVLVVAMCVPTVSAKSVYDEISVTIPVKGSGTFVLAEDTDAKTVVAEETFDGEGSFVLKFDDPCRCVYNLFQKGDADADQYLKIELEVDVDENDTLHAEYVIVDPVKDGKIAEVDFTSSPYRDNPPIKKVVKGNPSEDATFTFVVKAKSADCPMPEGSSGNEKTLTITGSGEKEIGWISFDKAGTYEYTVTEKNSGSKGYTYDSAVYTIHYEVVDNDGKLDGTRTIYKDGKLVENMSVITFTNTYSAGTSPSTPPTDDDHSGGGDRPGKGPEGVKTGDQNNIKTVAAIMATSIFLSAAAAVGIVQLRKKNRNRAESR